MSLFRTKETKVMIIIFGLFIQQLTNPGMNTKSCIIWPNYPKLFYFFAIEHIPRKQSCGKRMPALFSGYIGGRWFVIIR